MNWYLVPFALRLIKPRGDTRERLYDFLQWSLASAQTAQDPVLVSAPTVASHINSF